MFTGTTKSGFQFEIPEENFDDMELLDALAEADGGNVAAMPKAVRLLLGKEQKEKLYNHLRTEKGNVPIQKFFNEIEDIFAIKGQSGKNF